MMAEHKLNEARKIIESQLVNESLSREVYLNLYLEIHKTQQMKFPEDLSCELAEIKIINGETEQAINLLNQIQDEKLFTKKILLEIKLYEINSHFQKLYEKISDYLIFQFEKRKPSFNDSILNLINKYFKTDFGLNSKILSIYILRKDLNRSEALIQEIMITSFEKNNQRGNNEKLRILLKILKIGCDKNILEIYASLCFLLLKDRIEKKDFKKVIENLIFFEEFKIQLIILDLLRKNNLINEAHIYANYIKRNEKFNFIYLEKYFPSLKVFFKQKKTEVENYPYPLKQIDHDNSAIERKTPKKVIQEYIENEDEELSIQLGNILKFNSFTFEQLCDLCIGFLQIELPSIALNAIEKAIVDAKSNEQRIKCLFLKATCLFKMKDFRKTIDTCLIALGLSDTKDNILAFLYCQAEARMHLSEFEEAKRVLIKIISIDENYRLAKQKLEILNEY